MKALNLTKHALVRLNERTRLTEWQFNQIISKQLFINLGNKPGMNREHLLFYSKADNDCFVAIRDVLNGEIITVLTTEFHKNLAWDVNEELKLEAQRIQTYKAKAEDHKTRTLHISVSYMNNENQQKSKKVMGVQEFCGNGLQYLKKMSLDDVINAAKGKGISGKIISVSAKLGKSGPVEFRAMEAVI